MKLRTRSKLKASRSKHIGLFKTLKEHVAFIDGSVALKGTKVRILGVNMFAVHIQIPILGFSTAQTTHKSINWK
jgi:hypothetical protein